MRISGLKKGIITLKVRRTQNCLSIEESGSIRKFYTTRIHYSSNSQIGIGHFNILLTAQSFLTNAQTGQSFFINVKYMKTYFQFIIHLISHVLFMRKGNHVEFWMKDVTWLLTQNIKTN